jgi:hypothetical protein
MYAAVSFLYRWVCGIHFLRVHGMIHESRYWKEPLVRAANWLQKLRLEEATAERSLVRVERELFLGFYSIRKLLDTFKVSRTIRKMTFELQWAPNIGRVDYMNWHRLEELYDFGERGSETRGLSFLCNQFIHSYVFSTAETEHGALSGVFVASDRTRHEKLYFVSLDNVLAAFRAVGRDYPSESQMVRNPKTLQWEEVDEP